MNLSVSVVATYAKKLGLHFGEELPTEREFSNFVDRYAIAVKKIPVIMFSLDLKTHSEVIMLAM